MSATNNSNLQIVASGNEGKLLYVVPFGRKFVGYISPNGTLNSANIPDLATITMVGGSIYQATEVDGEVSYIVGIETSS